MIQGKAMLINAAQCGSCLIRRARSAQGMWGNRIQLRSFASSRMPMPQPRAIQSSRRIPPPVSQARANISSDAWNNELASITFQLQGLHIDLPDTVKRYAGEKMAEAIVSQKDLVREVDVRLSIPGLTERGPKLKRCEATLFTKKHGVIRAEEESDDVYTSIDNASRLLSKKLIKMKKKLGIHGRLRNKARSGLALQKSGAVKDAPVPVLEDEIQEEQALEAAEEAVAQAEDVESENEEIVREKLFEMPPMFPRDAVELMKNVGHDFYAFRNSATGEINVLYKRKHGGYGLIGPSSVPLKLSEDGKLNGVAEELIS